MNGKRVLVGLGAIAIVAVEWFTHPVITVLTLLTLLALTVTGWRHYRARSAALVSRWKARSDKNQGLASSWMILRACSWWTLRRHVKVLKPSVKYAPFWVRWCVPITELGTAIIKVGKVWLRTSVEEHTASFGGPRSGKSGSVGNLALSAPGAALIATTGGDLYHNTVANRAKLGPVVAFNPAGIGGVPGTLNFDPLTGCEDAVTAAERAADLISGTPMSDTKKDKEWVDLATSALASMLHAAALSGNTLHIVQTWVADPVTATPEILHHLKPSPAMLMEAGQFLTNDRHRDSICMLVMAALRWLANPTAAACTQRGEPLDIAKLLKQRGTIYLIAKKDGTVTPLITAFAGYIIREVRAIAEQCASERLEPAFTFIPDEAPNSCPLNLPVLLSDTGKYNITIHFVAQSFSQCCERWGDKGAGALLTNCATVIAFGGTKDPAGLATFATLIGRHGGGEVLSPAQIMQLPKLHAVVFRNGTLPTVGRPRMAWHRSDFRATERGKASVLRATRWATRWQAMCGAVKRLDRRRRVVAPAKPMLALTVGRSDSPEAQWQAALVKAGK